MIIAAHVDEHEKPVFMALTYDAHKKEYDTVSNTPYYKTKYEAWQAIKEHLRDAITRHRQLTAEYRSALKSGTGDAIKTAVRAFFRSQVALLNDISDICISPRVVKSLSVRGRDIDVYRVVEVVGPISVADQLQELVDNLECAPNLTESQELKLLLGCSSILDVVFDLGKQLADEDQP